MIRLYLHRLFHILQDSYSDLKGLTNFKINKDLLEEFSLQNQLRKDWRKILNYKILNEKFSIKNIKITKGKVIAKANITLIHSFNYHSSSSITKSKEKLTYIVILKKYNKKWTIIDICNKELFPYIYEKLIRKDLNLLTDSIIDIESRLTYLNSKLSSFRSDVLEFKKTFSNKLPKSDYRSNNYDSSSAVKYARKHALNYNPDYISYDKRGGDCTNFVSQCINFGNIPRSHSWKPYTTTWLRVNELYYYLTRKGHAIDITYKNTYNEGSILQFYSKSKGYFSHSGIITKIGATGECFYSCHSYDKLDFPLSEMFPLFYDKIRVIQPL